MSTHALATAPSADFLRLVPHEFARRHLVLSAGAGGGREALRIAASTPALAVFNVGVRLGRGCDAAQEPPDGLASAIDRAYASARPVEPEGADEEPAGPEASASGDDAPESFERALKAAEADVLNTAGKSAAARLVDLLIFEAVMRSASDVHLQPVNDRALVRYRLDGVLHTVRELPLQTMASVVGRVKVLAGLDLAEHEAPQDGRAGITVGGRGASGRAVDLRVSVLPSTYGERVVLRVLDPSRSPHMISFAALGMTPELERDYVALTERASGVILVTGPTGSGKTTTLYATLRHVAAIYTGAAHHPGAATAPNELNIMTIEDPVEFDLSVSGLAVSQTAVNPKRGVTFASGLRHILRQDPDVIMVGEIRDQETARIAVQASLTGHLVLSTLHTNDAASALARLLDLGVEPFLVSSSLNGVLAQRLVRRVHERCAGAGCGECLHSGFRGRLGVFELLPLTPEIRRLITTRATAQEIKQRACASGMMSLMDAGRKLAEAGVTTAEEALRVIQGAD
jgi:general secretion pathway protein E